MESQELTRRPSAKSKGPSSKSSESSESNNAGSPLKRDSELSSASASAAPARFEVGQTVIYPMMGKCAVIGLEEKAVGGETLSLYKLEVQKSSFSRSTRQSPEVWVPVGAAIAKGLRLPLQADGVDAIFKIFSSREFYFELTRPWNQLQPELEGAIRREGAVGLAKVASFLFVLKKRQIVPTPEVNRLSETVDRLLYRELSEASGEAIRSLEEKTKKMMRPKLTSDA
jgi:RNA polymerase-interacting CarD/CdnL/TRCF family regulator